MFFVPKTGKQKAMRIQIVTLFTALLALSACKSHKAAVATAPLSIPVVQVKEAELAHRMEFIGYLQSNFDAVIQPRVNGFLISKHFDSGKPVRRGALLYRIDPTQLSTAMYAAEAALQSARAEAVEARNNYERAVPLASMNAISRAQLDQYTAQYRASEASVRSAEESLRNAQLNVSYTELRSPIDGIAGSSQAHIGDFVGPGTEFNVLTTLSNVDTVSFDVALAMNDYLRLTGNRAEIYDNEGLLSDITLTLDDGTRYPLEGFYSHTRKDISSATGTLLLVVKFVNPNKELKAGQFARVGCDVGAKERRLILPARAVSQAQGVNSVWVVGADSTVQFRRVELGAQRDSLWVVTGGLEPTEWVVLAGRQKLHEGMKIQPRQVD